jgi:hypothetical protein
MGRDWQVRFGDPAGGNPTSPNLAGTARPSGALSAVHDFGTPFATSVHSSGRYLLDQHGQPFLVNGDSAWNLPYGLNSTDQGTYLTNRVTNGFNTIITRLVGYNGDLGTGGANWNGDAPFTGGNFTPNSAYWSKIDTYFQLCVQNGISVFCCPIDAYSTQSGTGNDFYGMTTTQATAYGQFLGNRYPQSTYPGVVWFLGDDYAGDGVGSGATTSFDAQYEALLTGLANAGDTRPVTIELGYNESLSTDSATWASRVQINCCYSYHPTYEVMLRGRAAATIPALFMEGAYENALSAAPWAPLDLRKLLAWPMTCGGCGTFYGNDKLWPFASGWQSYLDTSDVAQRKALNQVIAGVAWWTLAPDTTNALVAAGRNTELTTWQTTNESPYTNDSTYGSYVTAAYSADGKLAMIYNPSSSTLTLSATPLGANPSITRVDPTNGAQTALSWTTSLASPGNNAGGDPDWLYIITAA